MHYSKKNSASCVKTYHLVEMSPWPLFIAVSIFLMPVGLIMWLRLSSSDLLLSGLLLTTYISILWWRDVTREATYQGHHTTYVVRGLKLGMALFILSEVCFFFAFFWAYFHSSLAPSVEIGSVWTPPLGITPLPTFGVPLLNTSVLLLSGVSITWAHHAIVEGKFNAGLASPPWNSYSSNSFLYMQYGEYTETTFSHRSGVYGSTFFYNYGLFTVFHVLVGATFSFCLHSRLWAFHFSTTHHVGFLAAAWYWHLCDVVVWLFLYVSMYWWGA
uniref:Cytochrome c oxidase subunit 3 n=1 Tax=Cepaea nemoralis TaxID=28835 RepID=Q34183_CEPNE|nr:cytochrome oxidase subunit III [Cepaea nemoralis]